MARQQQAIRAFTAAQAANADEVFLAAFRDGVQEACDDFEEPDDDFDCSDWESLLPDTVNQRHRIMVLYLSALSRLGGELSTLTAGYRAQLLALRTALVQRGIGTFASTDAELASLSSEYAALYNRFRSDYDKVMVSIDRRLKQLVDGLVWSASELGYATAAQRMGRKIYWNLDSAAEHCSDCPNLADGSPYASVDEIGGVPGSDLTKCKHNCRCYLTYGR